MNRRTYHFTGRVQGVGFRATTRHVAAPYNVNGYVRNLPDGSVELVMEGPDDAMDGVVEELKQKMEGFIGRVQVSTAPATGGFNGFSIRH